MSLNSGAVLQVWLLGTERLGAPSKTVVSATISNPGQVPISFTLDYDPAWIVADYFYTVRAEIRDRGRLVFMSDRPVLVELSDKGGSIELVLIRAGGQR